jgi:hypothetical protein
MSDKSLQPVDAIVALEALARLLAIAQRDTGQSSRVASFLLAWHNAEENGGWNPVDLWQLDNAIGADMLLILRLIAQEHRYPDDPGFGPEITKVWERWRRPAS